MLRADSSFTQMLHWVRNGLALMKTLLLSLLAIFFAAWPAGLHSEVLQGEAQQLTSPDQVPEQWPNSDAIGIHAAYEAGQARNPSLAEPPIIAAGSATLTAEGCVPNNAVIDLGETVTVSFCVINTGTANTTNLVGTMQASGGVTPISGPQNYGVVTFGGPAVCRSFTFRNTSNVCGGTITVSIQIQDGATALGIATWTFTLGTTVVSSSQNFDGVVAPALPAGWTATNATGPAPLWVTSNTGAPTPASVSLPNALFIDDPALASDKLIQTPLFTPGIGARVSFANNFNLESTFDGGVLEISVSGGAYQDIITAGGSFAAGGYTGVISTSFGNPLAGRNAWTGSSGGFITSTANLPAGTAGFPCRLRFRMGSDNSVAKTGWRVDNFSVSQPSCCGSSQTPTPPPNDLCSGAITINCGQIISGSTALAAADAVPTCVTTLSSAPGVWYKFTGDGSTTTLDLCGSSYDTKIGVFSGSCAALTCVTGNDDFCGLQSRVTFVTTPGTTYNVLVTGFGTANGFFVLARTCVGSTPSTFANISTRLRVETGDNALIGGFIVTGTQPKRVILRAIGPSLTVPDKLADPTLELRSGSGTLIAASDNWRSLQEAEIIATGIPPANDLESAIVATLPANNSAYTAIVRGVNDGTGVALVEAYDLDRTVDSKLANISTRGLVQTGDNVLIGGLIVLGGSPLRIIVRAIGPSVSISGKLADPTLELRDGNGALIRSNDNWRTDQEAEIIATGVPPTNNLESAIVENVAPGNYTAIVRGVSNTTGVALVEAYGLN